MLMALSHMASKFQFVVCSMLVGGAFYIILLHRSIVHQYRQLMQEKKAIIWFSAVI